MRNAVSDGLSSLYTLVVPTYNRPTQFARLVRFLDRHAYPGRILVLDSGTDASHAASLDAARSVSRDITVERFDPATPVWKKFQKGAERVSTPYCGLCADDDLIVPASLGPILEHLERNADFAAAHGWYFSFYDQNDFGVTSVGYCGPSISDPDPLRRVQALLSNYEATTYAVHRTDVLRSALGRLQSLDSMLTKELAGGVITLMLGKVARVPYLYYGRSLAPSEPYRHWHPLEILADSPETLLRHYAAYRQVLADTLHELSPGRRREDLESCLDLLHLRYLSPYLRPPVLDYLFEKRLSGVPLKDVMADVWGVLAAADTGKPAVAPASLSRYAKAMLRRWMPLQAKRAARRVAGHPVQQVIEASTRSGVRRKYLVYPQFLAAIAPLREQAPEVAGLLIDALNAYE